jgi:hypothetical protein
VKLLRLAALCAAMAACADVLELTDRTDAVEQLCGCSDEVPQFEGACVETLSDRLAGVSDQTRADWLGFFAERCGGSDGVCPHAYECYARPGTCAALACKADNECCGFLEGAVCKEDGLCGAPPAQ